MDRSAREGATKAQAAVYRKQGTRYSNAFNIVETPVFMSSEDSRMLQLADFVANAILRRYRPAPKADARYFDKPILPKLDVERGNRHGLLHITDAHCQCPGRHYRYLTLPASPSSP